MPNVAECPVRPPGVKPSDTRTLLAAVTSALPTTMSQSMTGLAARPGTDVLPTCLIALTGTRAAAMAAAYSARKASKRSGQEGSYSTTARSSRHKADSTPTLALGLALLGGPQDRNGPLTCGAKGTRTPGLLDANQIHGGHLRSLRQARAAFGSVRVRQSQRGCCTLLLHYQLGSSVRPLGGGLPGRGPSGRTVSPRE
jgi:hypothetical protein